MKTYVSALILASALALPQGAHAERSGDPVPPPVPDAIQVPPEFTPYLAAHAYSKPLSSGTAPPGATS